MNFCKLLRTCLLISVLMSGSTLVAQNALRLSHLWSRTNVSFDLNRLYNYNIYERNRWGAGFFLETPLKYDTRYGTLFQNTFYGDIYGAYGTGDRALKGGGSLQLRFPRYMLQRISVGYMHDIERVGRHDFNSYNIVNTYENSSYFSSHYSAIDRLEASVRVDLPGPTAFAFAYRHSAERMLFDAHGLLFPSIDEADALPRIKYDELLLQMDWGKHLKFEILAGRWNPYDATLAEGDRRYLHLFGQYANRLTLPNNHGVVSLYAQGGTTATGHTPLSRRFDISGAGITRYYFNNTFLTVRPNSFMADGYVTLHLGYAMSRPLWNARLSKPTPFVQVGAMWGTLYGDDVTDGTGNYHLLTGAPVDSGDPYAIAIRAPYQGLLEPAIGIDNLFRWGMLDLGVAAAYQLTPKNSAYHLDNFSDKFSVMLVAKLVFEYNI